DPTDRHDFQMILYVVRDLSEILYVFFWNQHSLDTTAVGCQQLFLQTADRKHFTTKRDFTRHGDISTHRYTGQSGHHCGGDCNTCRWTVLGRCAFRKVNVQVSLLESRVGDAPLLSTRTYHRTGRLDGFLHHITDGSCAQDHTLTRHVCHFDGEKISADFCPGKTGDLTNLVLLFGHAEGVLTYTEEVGEVFRGNVNHIELLVICLSLAFSCAGRFRSLKQKLFDHLTADLADLALQAPNPSLTCVITHDIANGILIDDEFAFPHAVILHQLGQEVIESNVHFLVLGVTRETDHFHPVQQSRRNVQRIAGRYEHDVGKIEIDLHVVILEGVVLFGIQHLQQRGRWIAAEIRA